MENIQVSIRCKPTDSSLVKTKNNNLTLEDPNTHASSNTQTSHSFTFDYIFDTNSSQTNLYDTLIRKSVESTAEGYNTTIFAYGASGSGKSYTMFGSKKDNGIIPRACDNIFTLINNNQNVVEANIKCSFIEIYRENIKDLLNFSENKNHIKLRQCSDAVKGVYLQGVIEKYVYSASEILDTIKEGTSQRTTASTSINNTSSRSHAVLTLSISQKMIDGTEIRSKLNLVDLAGSENVGKSEVQGINLLEAQTINKSLSCLGNVIYALTDKKRDHIPYRDSKLTYLLQDSLGGNSKTILIATIAPNNFSETFSTLKFAKRAKEIKNQPKINKNDSIEVLLKTIETLEKKLADITIKYEELSQDIKRSNDRTELSIIDDEKLSEKVNELEKNNLILSSRCNRMEEKITYLDLEVNKRKEENEKMIELFQKQRELSIKCSRKLYIEKLRTCGLKNELDQYKLIYEILEKSTSFQEIFQEMIEVIKPNQSTLMRDIEKYEQNDELSEFDPEKELLSEPIDEDQN